MVKRKKVIERLNGIYFNNAEIDTVINFLIGIRDEHKNKYLSIEFIENSDPWDDGLISYDIVGNRWETVEEVDARVAAVKNAKKINLEKERKEYERLKKKFEK